MNRRMFLQSVGTVAASLSLPVRAATDKQIMTVRGRISARDMGVALTHEHALASFQPHEEWARRPLTYDRDEVVEVVLPHLLRIRELGCKTFVDATAVGVGRDAALLQRLSERSGLHVLTVTGNYAAIQYRQLPPHVFTDTPDALAQRWIREWQDGIEGTNVRPGLIKLGFNGEALSQVEKKLILAGAIAHRETGLTIGAHTGPAIAAFEQLAILESARVDPSAWIWIHAQNEPDLQRHIAAARRGAWISFDGLGPDSVEEYVTRVLTLRNSGLLQRTLISHDAGWYTVGKPRGGGDFRPFDTVFTKFVPALRAKGFTQAEIDTLLIDNPANAFAIAVRVL